MAKAPTPWLGVPRASTLRLAVSNEAGFAARATVLTVSGATSATDRLFHHDLAGTIWSSAPLAAGAFMSAHLHIDFLSATPVTATVTISVVDKSDTPVGPTYRGKFTGQGGDDEQSIPVLVTT